MSYTPLENAVMRALAWDLRDTAPDLEGQFEESLPGARRNTGSGMTTEMIVNFRRPAARKTPTGSFGTVHAMVGDLPGSMAFKATLRDGVLLSLEGDAFDMDTTDVDFRTTPFHTVFTVDQRGTSIAFDPRAVLKPSPLVDLQSWNDPDPSAASPDAPPRLVNIGALQRVQDAAAALDNPRSRDELKAPRWEPEQIPLLAGLAVFVLFLVVILTLVFRVPFPLVFAALFLIGRFGLNPRGIRMLQKALTQVRLMLGQPKT